MRISDWSSDVCSSDLKGRVALLTRQGLDWTERFGGLARSIADLPVKSALIDGEIVVQTETGVARFTALVEALKSSSGDLRSEERRVGKECVSTCRSRWLPDN